MKPVIICGGVGTKMWPMSRTSHPKHFLPLINGKSLFQLNYEALLKKFKPEEIYIQTTEIQAKTVFEQEPSIPVSNCFIEPALRNHGPAMGFMAIQLMRINPDEPFFLVQADVLRTPDDKLLEMIDLCDVLVKRNGKLITGGFRPEFAMMGVDYLASGEKLNDTNEINVFKIDKFLWRGTKEDVDKYVAQNSVFLHANHYSWTPRFLLNAFQKWAPDWYDALKIIETHLLNGNEIGVREEYSKMAEGPVEKITEHLFPESYVVEVPFKWFDFGTWESYFKYMNEKGEYSEDDEVIKIDVENCYLRKNRKNLVALIGVKDLYIVDTDDALLICRNDQSGKVGDIVKALKEKEKKEYL